MQVKKKPCMVYTVTMCLISWKHSRGSETLIYNILGPAWVHRLQMLLMILWAPATNEAKRQSAFVTIGCASYRCCWCWPPAAPVAKKQLLKQKELRMKSHGDKTKTKVCKNRTNSCFPLKLYKYKYCHNINVNQIITSTWFFFKNHIFKQFYQVSHAYSKHALHAYM